MAGLEADTSSYPRPAAPAADKSLLDQVGQYQQLESQNLTINKQKLDLYNTHFNLINDELSTLANDPKTTPQEVMTRLHRRLDAFQAPPNVKQMMESEFADLPNGPLGKDGATNPELARRLDFAKRRAQSINERVNSLYGSPGAADNGATVTPTRTYERGGPVPAGLPIAKQNPPSTIQYDTNRTSPDGSPNPDYGQPNYRGPQAPVVPPGAVQAPGGLPGQYRLPIAPAPQLQPGFRSGTSNDTPNNVVQDRFKLTSGAAGLPPGAAEASTAAGVASGGVLASERNKASNFQRDIFPLAQAIPALEKLGTKGTGPGTETINHLKSFVLSNIPGVTEKDFGLGNIKDFDKAKKYLTDFVNQTGNSGTNDKLAAAFAGNPSVGISNAAAVDVAKSALALRRLQQSKYLAFEDSGLQPDQASRFFANGTIKTPSGGSLRVSQIDPRAFGVSEMSDKAKKILLDELKKNPREMDLFNKSLEVAKQHGYLSPR